MARECLRLCRVGKACSSIRSFQFTLLIEISQEELFVLHKEVICSLYFFELLFCHLYLRLRGAGKYIWMKFLGQLSVRLFYSFIAIRFFNSQYSAINKSVRNGFTYFGWIFPCCYFVRKLFTDSEISIHCSQKVKFT